MGNVVGLRGEAVPKATHEPRKDVVERLEWLLEAAKSGEIIGLAAVYVFRDEAAGQGVSGWRNYSMIGRLADLQRRILLDLAD